MLRRKLIGISGGLALSLVSLSVPASSQAANNAVAQKKASDIAQANGFQAGQVKSVSGGTLTLTPYNGASNMTQFYLPSNTPVYQGTGAITTAGLMPGVDVRVHYKNATGGQNPQIAAIEVLNKEEANAARAQANAAPPQMTAQNQPPIAPAPAPTPAPAPVPPPVQAQPQPQAQWPSGNAPTAQVSPQQKQSIISRASGSQPGKIDKVAAGYLMLKPYQRAAGEATLRFDPNTPVYQGNGAVSWQALQSGTDVRVYYKESGKHEKPKVVAVEILNARQARQTERSERDIPRGQ